MEPAQTCFLVLRHTLNSFTTEILASYPFNFANIFLADVPKAFTAQAVPLGCSAELSWNTPSSNTCPITRYTIHYRESMTTGSLPGVWQTTVLNEPNITNYRLWLSCSKRYDIMVMTWNERGHNDYSEESVRSVLSDTGMDYRLHASLKIQCIKSARA